MSVKDGSSRGTFFRLLFRNRTALVGFILAGAIGGASMLAGVMPLPDPNHVQPARRLMPLFSPGHPLGTDGLGRDILSRTLWGGQRSLVAGVGAALLSMAVGVTIGVVSGFYAGSRIDAILMRITDVVLAFPTMILALAIVAALGPGLMNAVVALSVASYPLYARVVRSVVLSLREREFVSAAQAIGAGDRRLIGYHILPNIVSPVVVTFSLDVGAKIVQTASLSFLGLGSQPPLADWGSMLATGRTVLTIAPHVAIVPAVAISLFVLGMNLLGDGINDVLDPQKQR